MPRGKRRYNRKRRKGFPSTRGDKEVTVNENAYQNQAVIYKGIGLPDTFITKLRYTTIVSFSIAEFARHLFRGNSIYDPDATGTGGQPMFFDQLAALYANYTVYGSSIDVQFVNRSSSTESAFIKVGVFPIDAITTSSGDINTASERNRCRFAILGSNQGDQGIINIKNYARSTNMLGVSRNEKDDNTLSSLVNDNPAKQWYWSAWAGSLNQSAIAQVYATINMTYYVKFNGLKNVARS